MKTQIQKNWRMMAKWIARDKEKESATEGSERLADYAKLRNLCAELIGIDTPEMVQNRIAMQGPQGYIENSPELYGQSLNETIRKYYKGGSFVESKDDCDVELSENDKAIVDATLHTGDVEKPL